MTTIYKKHDVSSDLIREVGSRIRRRRLEHNWNQSELARRSKMCQANVSAIENGQRMLNLSRLIDIAQALGVGIDDLIGEA